MFFLDPLNAISIQNKIPGSVRQCLHTTIGIIFSCLKDWTFILVLSYFYSPLQQCFPIRKLPPSSLNCGLSGRELGIKNVDRLQVPEEQIGKHCHTAQTKKQKKLGFDYTDSSIYLLWLDKNVRYVCIQNWLLSFRVWIINIINIVRIERTMLCLSLNGAHLDQDIKPLYFNHRWWIFFQMFQVYLKKDLIMPTPITLFIHDALLKLIETDWTRINKMSGYEYLQWRWCFIFTLALHL